MNKDCVGINMRVTESRLRSIIREVLKESSSDAFKAEEDWAEMGWVGKDDKKTKKGIKLRKDDKKTKKGIKFPERKIKKAERELKQLNQEFDEGSIDFVWKDNNPVKMRKYKKIDPYDTNNLWESYYEYLDNKEFAFNNDGTRAEHDDTSYTGTRGLVLKLHDHLYFSMYTDEDKLYFVKSGARNEIIRKLLLDKGISPDVNKVIEYSKKFDNSENSEKYKFGKFLERKGFTRKITM